MSSEKPIYAVPMKCRGNDYIRIANKSEKSPSWKEQTAPYSSHTPLMMADGSNTTPSGVFNNRGNHIDFRTDLYGNTQQDFPSLPARKKPPRSYIRETKNTNPVAIPNGKRDKFDSVGHSGLKENPESIERSNSTNCQEVFDSYDGNGYLTPTDPPAYVDSGLDYSSTDFHSIGSETSTHSIHKRGGRPFQRFDSGVGDCESVRGSSSVRFSTSPTCSTNSVSSPRLSTQYEQQYEDIDQYHRTHQHQNHVPQRRSTDKMKTDSVRNGLPQLPQVDISGVTNSDSEDTDPAINSSVAEIISHPMHDPRIGSLPHTYMPLNTTNHPMDSIKAAKAPRISCWIIVFLIIILIISVTALCLSIYTFVSKPVISQTLALERSGNSSIIDQSDFDSALVSLQQKVEDLIKENAALKESLLHQQNNLTNFIEQKVKELSSNQEHLSSTLQQIEAKFDSEIANISLTPGPQGPPGVANFSLCVTRSILRSAPASSSALTETSYLPTDTELQDYFVTFAYCTYEGASGAHLEMQLDPTINRYKYRCRCWGQTTGVAQTLCKTIIWMCPDGN
ncbi:unnamed protein product [Candidula unifasciata]|uniref:Uncharacterized protein n=1 Tax=Candidula unifasciata TaxID=100452 RepID=A0A8S3ZGY1_9EUPU|nr:unnamed protein product [Candidula unifasciata]